MITFSCSACHKKLSVKEALAGKKVKCPACGQATVIPVQAAAAAGNEAMRILPLSPDSPPESHIQSALDEAARAATPAPSSPDATQACPAPEADPDASLTDFLAPRQADNELGRLGKYRILKILGHGGMGVVYQAEDPNLKRTVAIKAMLPTLAVSASAGKRFVREAQATAAVEHDHIVRIYQVDEDRGVPFLAMEFLKGEPLDARLKREATLPVLEVVRIGREIAEALGAAHTTGLIHRDIKPGNIWLEAPRGRVKILDFGLARAISDDSGLTQQGAIIGTPSYMAPEQGRGDPVDGRTDLFSLGVVLYRLCTGQLPFQGKDTVSTLMAVAMHEPAPPGTRNADLPTELSDLVMKLLEKDPARRFATASEVVETLQALEKKLARQKEAEEATLALTGAAPERAAAVPAQPGTARGRQWPLVLAALLLLAGLAAVGTLALIRIQTEEGDYVIRTDDPDFVFQVTKGGVTLQDKKSKRTYNLKVLRQDPATGEHELEVTDADAGLSFKTKTFTIRRDQQVALKAWFERKHEAVVRGTPADDAWLKQVASLPPEKQVEAVAAKLKERNPGFDGKVKHNFAGGVVASLVIVSDGVTDISPVRALPQLFDFSCIASTPGKGKLVDLSPLRGTKVGNLSCYGMMVSDLTPLKDLKLLYLDCGHTRVSDLTPLQAMLLKSLFCHNTPVADLTPLKNMPLKSLRCDFKPERDTAILRSIKTLETINGKPAAEFWKDVDAQGAAFDAWRKQVAALPPEKQVEAVAAKLKERNPGFDGPVSHVKTEGGVVTEIKVPTYNVTDLSPVRALTGLRALHCGSGRPSQGKLTDLTPLKGMKLTTLTFNGTQVSDLTPLKDLPLTSLNCSGTPVSDLTPIKDLKLKSFYCVQTQVKDLSPLRGMPLQEILCDFRPQRDAAILRSIQTLATINRKPAAEFWKEVSAQAKKRTTLP